MSNRRYRYKPGDENNLDLADDAFIARTLHTARWAERYFRYEVHGLERIPTGRGLIITPHSAITADGFLLGKAIYEVYGRLPRGLTDHMIFDIPGARDVFIRLGIVDGNRENAVRLLERDELCFAMPGGGNEAFKASSQRYQILWEGHTGFVRVALAARAPIIPSVCIGADDALWLPFDAMKLGKRVLGARIPLFPGIGFGPLPFPVKFTAYIDDPIVFDEPPEAADDDEVVARCHKRVVDAIETMLRNGLDRRQSKWT